MGFSWSRISRSQMFTLNSLIATIFKSQTQDISETGESLLLYIRPVSIQLSSSDTCLMHCTIMTCQSYIKFVLLLRLLSFYFFGARIVLSDSFGTTSNSVFCIISSIIDFIVTSKKWNAFE